MLNGDIDHHAQIAAPQLIKPLFNLSTIRQNCIAKVAKLNTILTETD